MQFFFKSLFAFVIIVSHVVLTARAQSEILAISSYNSCVDVDSRYSIPNVNQANTNINCAPPSTGDPPPVITTLDLRLITGLTNTGNFTFNLGLVPGPPNSGTSSSSTSTLQCQASDNTNNICQTTTPAEISVTSTNIVYKYKLQPAGKIPYCYGSMSMFEGDYNARTVCKSPNSTTGGSCTVTDPSAVPPEHCYGQISPSSCIPVQYYSDAIQSLLNIQLNPLATASSTDYFKLNAFLRTYQPYYNQIMCCTNTNYGEYFNGFFASNPCKSAFTGVIPLTTAYQGNLRVNNASCNLLSNAAYHPTLFYDNPNTDIRIPAFMPNPNIFGLTPSPIFRNTIDSPITSAADIIMPGSPTEAFIVQSLKGGSYLYGCAGPSCGANQDSRRLQAVTAQEDIPVQFVNTINNIFAIGPTCTVYYIVPEPQVYAKINVSVTTASGVEVLSIDNFNSYSGDRSLPAGYVFGKIVDIQVPNNIIGPSIPGAIIVCGEKNQQFLNMQCLIEGVVCDGDQKVILEQSPGFSETINPWATIMKQSSNQDQMPLRKNFFPHPYDYAIPTTANGKTSGFTSIPNNTGQSFWHFVDIARLTQQYGVDCNKIGMNIGGNNVQQMSNLLCNMEPHSCLPGLGQYINGGLKDALSCKVSQYFNFASGLFDQSTIPLPYGDNQTVFLDEMTTSAMNFMPNNPFLLRNNLNTGLDAQSLYNPKDPGFWIGGDGYLYLSPATSDGQDYQTNVAVEVVLDIVGTFVSYEVDVAKAIIVVDECECLVIQGEPNQINITVENLSEPGVGVSTDYLLLLDCQEQNSDMVIITNPDQIEINDLLPGEKRVVSAVVTASGVLDINQIVCLATLAYAETTVGAFSDQQNLTCQYLVIPPSNETYNAGLQTPNVPPPPDPKCKTWGSPKCQIDQGKPYENGWVIVATVIGVLAMCLLAAVFIYTIVKWSKRQNKMNELDASAKEITEKTKTT